MKKKTLRNIKILLSGLFLISIFLFHFYIPRFITEIKNPIISFVRGSHLITTTQTYSQDTTNGRKIQFSSYDQTQLVAYETYSKLDSISGTIILLHGIKSNKEYFIEFSNFLATEGFNVVALDLRAHGESSGTNCTFGTYEKQDVSNLIDILIEENPNQKIGIFGQSLGGAIALQTLEIDKRLKFGIIESTFSDLRSTMHDYFKYHFKFNIDFLSNYLLNRSGKIANFNPDKVSPFNACKNITQPVMMVHGVNDKRINLKYGKSNFSQLKNEGSKFIAIENASHQNVWEIGGDKYFQEIIEFLKKTVGNNI